MNSLDQKLDVIEWNKETRIFDPLEPQTLSSIITRAKRKKWIIVEFLSSKSPIRTIWTPFQEPAIVEYQYKSVAIAPTFLPNKHLKSYMMYKEIKQAEEAASIAAANLIAEEEKESVEKHQQYGKRKDKSVSTGLSVSVVAEKAEQLQDEITSALFEHKLDGIGVDNSSDYENIDDGDFIEDDPLLDENQDESEESPDDFQVVNRKGYQEPTLASILSAIKESEARTEQRILQMEKKSEERFSELKGLIRDAHKDISDIYEVAVRTQVWEMIVSSFPHWSVLWPLGGKDLNFAHYKPLFSNSVSSPNPRKVKESFQRLFSKLPKSHDEKKRNPFPEIIEADCIFKFRSLYNDSNEIYSPDKGMLPDKLPTMDKKEYSEILPQSHVAQTFHHLAVAEISRSRYICNTAERYLRSENSWGKIDYGSLELLRKFLQLERVIWSLNAHYQPETDEFLQLAVIVSPSFRGLDNKATQLIDAVISSDPIAFPELRRLHERGRLWLISA
ncbi:hypothetical protein HK098_005389 [Nowakowskiella sp. JEL0407]|nr:hypothetical protein HK098_005389 [Nowakowskiella sp. JEL0407]